MAGTWDLAIDSTNFMTRKHWAPGTLAIGKSMGNPCLDETPGPSKDTPVDQLWLRDLYYWSGDDELARGRLIR